VRAGLAEPEKAEAAIRAAAAEADAVVVSIHWGREYFAQPDPAQVELGHRLADAGALVIFGHHPHVLQPLELYRRADGQLAAIAYSLGNFISNQSRNYVHGVTPEKVGDTRDAALVRVQLAKRDYGRGVVRTELTGLDFLPLWTENDTAELDAKKNPGLKPTIRVVAVDRALNEVRAELASLPNPLPKDQEARFIKLRKREELYQRRKELISNLLGPDYLRELAPPK
jgi:poly-gamma-glutamate synthesis protein (capsule biosynthesis protein)